MTQEPRSRLTLIRPAAELLDAAVGRAAERVQALLDEESVPREVGHALLERTRAETHTRLSSPGTGPADPDLATDPLFYPVVALVRHELLAEDHERDNARSALMVVRALDELAPVNLAAGGASGADDDLRARLRAPDAFELLIEVAHDFRSPLTSILFLSETLRDGHSGPVTEQQHSQLGLIYSAAFGLAAVASDVMDLARREENLIQDETQAYRLSEVFDSVRRLVNPIVEEKGLELRVDVPEGAQVRGHPHAVSRVLLNLTTNALKFTDEGFVTIGVRAVGRARIEFFVQDTGRGIPESRQAELFLPFKRRLGENQEGHFFSGSGVGLSIAHRLVRAMGSELLLETSDENGTRFSFEVPIGLTRPTRA